MSAKRTRSRSASSAKSSSAKSTIVKSRGSQAPRLGKIPTRPAKPALVPAHLILTASHQSAESFLDTFDRVRKARKAVGAPTDEEQDLLRAMLLFAGAGLDSMIKQLTRDALPLVVSRDEGAHKMLQDHVQRRIGLRDGTAPDRAVTLDLRFVASILTATSPRSAGIRDLVHATTSDSMQSKEQVLKAAANFGIASRLITHDFDQLARVFQTRNEIAHEMDVDLHAGNRRRRSRRLEDMRTSTRTLLEVGAAFLKEVEAKLAQDELTL